MTSILTATLSINKRICQIFTLSRFIKTPIFKRDIIRFTIAFLCFGLCGLQSEVRAQVTISDSTTYKYSQKSNQDVIGIRPPSAEYKFGGTVGLIEFLSENIQYPSDSIEGKVFAKFIVDTLGKPTQMQIVRGLSAEADAEVLRLVALLEFIPASENGKKIETEFILPISFSLKSGSTIIKRKKSGLRRSE